MAEPLIGLSWINHVDRTAAMLSASQEISGLGVANLADSIIGRRWRTTSLTGYATIDFGANVDIEVLALRFPRDTTFPTSGTVTHVLDADGGTAGAGATYNSGAVAIDTAEGYGYHVHIPAALKTARYWRFTFSVTGLSYIDVGRAWAGEFWRPTYNIAFGYEDGWGDLSRISASARSGAEFVDKRERQRQFVFGLEALDSDERDDIREMQRIVGLSEQVLFVKKPTAPAKETVIGRLEQTTPIRHTDLPIFSKAFTIRESL